MYLAPLGERPTKLTSGLGTGDSRQLLLGLNHLTGDARMMKVRALLPIA